MNRYDFQKLARLRIREAKVLLKYNCFDGAYYLAGYAVECAIKACIAKSTKKYDFPEKDFFSKCYVHDLRTLIKAAGLEIKLTAEMNANRGFNVNWSTVKDWSEQFRYKMNISQAQANDLCFAISDKRNGVLQWLKKHW